jgi:recombination protein RecA
MINVDFIKTINKQLEKIETVYMDFGPPKKWYSTGNYALNKVMSGSFLRGIPESRITCLAGPSGSGKSFLGCNILKHAQDTGAFIVILDSENALDKNFMEAVGIDTSPSKLLYIGVTLFSDVVKVLSEFLTTYEKQYGKNNPDSPPVVMFLDSLDMLLTDNENENFISGVQKGDQGQRAKQAKHMLKTVVSRIKRLPISFIVTHQVYPNTDLLNGEGMWIINNAIRYSASQIMLITKLKLKEGTDIIGIRMRVECYKSRFAKLGSKIEIEVPYDRGMDPYSGFLDMMEENKIITKGGAWYSYTKKDGETIKFQAKNLTEELVNEMLQDPRIQEEEKTVEKLMLELSNDVEDNEDEQESKSRRNRQSQ